MRSIYAKLFKMQIRDFPSYRHLLNIEQLESYLKNRRATLQDMQEIYSTRNHIENKRKNDTIKTDYKLRQTGEIISKIEYVEIDADDKITTKVLYLVEDSGFYAPHLVLDNFPKQKVEELLQSLVESRLIQRVEKVFLKIVDDKLRYLIHDFHVITIFKSKNTRNIREKHADTIKEYEFLHDTIKEIYPEF